ncbi:MAG: hypothetical protein KAG20_00400 [Cocleimonas sp.]|nr:hypothetical protein [Cocleimonas sp.]
MSATHIHVDGIVLIVSLLFASLFILLGSSFYLLHSNIGFNLMTHVTERLDEEGFQFSVAFDGRDGFISGSVKDEATKKEVISIAESIEGVRIIDNELTVFSALETNESYSNNESVLLPIAAVNIPPKEEALDKIVVSPVSTLAPPPSAIKNVLSVEKENNEASNLTEMTRKVILEEFIVHFKSDMTQLSLVDKISLNIFSTKLTSDSLLFVEISSFHLKPSIAVKRAETIRDLFAESGMMNREHFSILWHDSEDKNQVQIKLFRNK